MGFPREMVLQAMQVAGNNPDIAVGILTGEVGFQGGGNQGFGGDFGDDEGQGGENAGVFDTLKDTPQFQQLRVLARQNPAMLEQFLTQLPQNVVQIITDNQEEFIRLLQQDPVVQDPVVQGGQGQGQGQARVQQGRPQGGQVGGPFGGQGQGLGLGLGQGQGQGQVMPQQVQVRVTPEDQAVIQNLMDLSGCDKNKVTQAYFLFEKDAEMAANYLLNHGQDEGDGFGGY